MKLIINYFYYTSLSLVILLSVQSCKQSSKPSELTVRPTDTGTGHLSISINSGYINEDKVSIEKEIKKFHEEYNSGDFAAIFKNSVQQFQQSQSMSDIVKVMKAQRKEAGEFKSVIDKRVNVIVRAPVEGRAAYVSQYANLVLTEMFLFVKVGSDYKLSWYQPSKGGGELPNL